MDILTLSLAVKKALAAMGLKIEPAKTVLRGKLTGDGYGSTETISLVPGVEYSVALTGNSGEKIEIGRGIAQGVEGATYVGNMALFDEEAPDTGELFLTLTIPTGDTKTLVVISGGGTANFVIERTETIHPIDPKYLPGVCLPVVELSTEIPIDGTEVTLSTEEGTLLTKACESGIPVCMKIRLGISENITTPFSAVFTLGTEDANSALFCMLNGTLITIKSKDSVWTATFG